MAKKKSKPFAHTKRTFRNVADILRFAKPHWRGFVLTYALMALSSIASSGRIIIMYPIFTRIIPATAEETGGMTGKIQKALESQGWLKDRMDGVTDALNTQTQHLVPDSWLDPDFPGDRDRYATLFTVFFMFVLAAAILAFTSYAVGMVATRTALRVLMDVRESLCRSLLDQPVAFYDQGTRGDVIQRMLGDVEAYSAGINLVLRDVSKGFLHVTITMGIMVMVSWKLALICCLGIPFLFPIRKMALKTLKRAHKRQEESAKRAELVMQILSGIRTVKAFHTEKRRVAEFRRADEKVTRRALKAQAAKSQAAALTDLVNNSLAILLACGGGWLLMQGKLGISIGELALFLGLTLNLYQPIKRLIRQYNNLQDSMASIERTTEYLNLEPGYPDAPDATAFPGLRDSIRFDRLDFEYIQGQPVLQDVSFEIPIGHTVALVGPSGGGKSTLCDLLLRFHEPKSGEILVDGKPLRSFTRESFLQKTAVVTQTPFLFHTSIRENIKQGKLDATDEEIMDAARAAQMHDYIISQPQGYEGYVGEGGVRLSGGQRQRITIARALVRNPEILILDEATASLDTESEKAVQAALERLQEGRTTLVVAHRLSTVRHADQILVLDGGRIVEQGTHEGLIAQRGIYSKLVELQDLSPATAPDTDTP